MKSQKTRTFQCNYCKTIYFIPADAMPEELKYCDNCSLHGKKRQIKELFAEKRPKPSNKSMEKIKLNTKPMVSPNR